MECAGIAQRAKPLGLLGHLVFFSKSKLPLEKWLLAILWWSRQYPVIQMALEAEITESVAIDIYNWLREVCSTKLLQNPIILGGPGVIVQADESRPIQA